MNLSQVFPLRLSAHDVTPFAQGYILICAPITSRVTFTLARCASLTSNFRSRDTRAAPSSLDADRDAMISRRRALQKLTQFLLASPLFCAKKFAGEADPMMDLFNVFDFAKLAQSR